MKRRNSEGFTLVEVIISIAVLSIVSVFILQMFVTSAQLNASARDIDKVNNWTSTLMETFHMTGDPMAFGEADVFADPLIERDGENLTVTSYFNKNWEPVPPQGERAFSLTAKITHDEDGASTALGLLGDSGSVRGALYTLEVTAVRLSDTGEDVLLGQTVNTNYFQLEGVARR